VKAEYYGLIFAILSPFFSSVATIFKTGSAKILSPLIVVGIGGIIGSVLLFLLASLFREKFSFAKMRKYWKELTYLTILRVLLGELLLTFGLSQTEAIKAIFLTKVEPYFVLLISWLFLKETIRSKHAVLLGIHLVGAVILSTGGNINILGRAQIGDLLIILAMGMFALSYKYGKRLAENIGSMYSNAISLGIGSLLVLPFVFIFPSPFQFINQSTGWLYLFIYVILFNVIGLTLWYKSLKSVKGWIVSALRYVGPILGAPIAYVVLKETLSLIQIFGAIIVLITSFLIVREHLKTVKSSS